MFVLTAVKGHAGIPNPGLCTEDSLALRSDGIRPTEERVDDGVNLSLGKPVTAETQIPFAVCLCGRL